MILRKYPAWAAPVLFRSEFRNVLAFYFRRRIVDLETAQGIMQAAEARMTGFEYEEGRRTPAFLAARRSDGQGTKAK